MNKDRYRLVFNKTRGIPMAVAETASARGKSPRVRSATCAISHSISGNALRALVWALSFAFAYPCASFAQVVADQTALANRRPNVLSAPNGVTQVDIQKPSAAGVSRNAYSRFDVQPSGVILNNARTNAQTQLGGWIQGNPNLTSGSARIILNEVNSADPSYLRGYVEVAGSRAQVVIANPAGISCEGCGFINAERSTLTTGVPLFSGDGDLSGYRVEGGQVTISGQGFDDSRSDYTDIIARSVQVNASIWSKELKITVGANQVNAANTSATPIAGTGTAAAFGIDVAQLGGMYAGKIVLVGTEAGVGVRNAGTLGASSDEVAITADGLFQNSGSISTASDLRIDALALTHTGTITADRDVAIDLASDYTNTNAIQAGRDLELDTTGNITNHDELLAGQTLNLNAASLDNLAGAQIAAHTTELNVTGALSNRGTIDGVDTTVHAQMVHNLQGGSVFGDHLAIQADQLDNESGAVIAARDRLDIGATALDNRTDGLLFSAGDMAIGGALDANRNASGSAATLVNEGASIEALGDLGIDAQTIQNLNAGLTTQNVVTGTAQYDKFTPDNTSALLDSADYPGAQIGNFNISFRDAGPYHFREYWRYVYTGTTTQTQVLSSLPGSITAGGNLTLHGDVENHDSQIIAGQALTITGGTLQNINTAGGTVTAYHGTAYYYDYDGWESCSDPGDGCYDISSSTYNPANTVSTFNLPTTTTAQNTAPTGSGTVVANAAVPASNGLFSANPNPQGAYLIETNPRFANYRTWLSSDYMLQQLALDPALTQKRLGDGFYEQRLMREQVAQLTGRRFLEGYANDEAQYQALMNAGVTQAHALQLIPGVALSAEQIARLTSDIVWLVEQTVTLPDGTQTKAWVLQVYVQVKQGDLHPTTGLMAGNTVNIDVSGDIANGGSIAGRSLLTLNADNVRNLGGALWADTVSVAATKDVEVLGGSVTARDALSLDAGNNIDVASTTHDSDQRYGASHFTRTNIDRVAGLYVTGDNGLLLASAGKDITLKGATLVNSGANGVTMIDAGRDIKLGTVTTAEQNSSARNAKNYVKHGGTQEVGNTIQAAGGAELNAGHDISARAATLSSDAGGIDLVASNDVKLGAGRETGNFDAARKVKHSGTFSSRTNTYRDTYASDTSVGTRLSGETVNVQAGHDIGLKGSSVVSTQSTQLAAGSDINIEADIDTDAQSHYQKEKRSGFSVGSAGTLSVGYSKSSAQNNSAFYDETAAASVIGSVKGDVQISAGQALKMQGSDLVAGGDARLIAKQVDIDATAEQHRSTQLQKHKQSGISVGIVGTPLDTLANLKDASQAKGTLSKIDQIGHEIGASAMTTPQLAINFGSSKSKSSVQVDEVTHRGSSLTAGGDLVISATGTDLSATGSNFSAGGLALLAAKRDVVLQASTDTYSQNSQAKQSQWNFSTAVPSPGDAVRQITGGPNHSGVKSFPYGQGKSKDNGNTSATFQNATSLTANNVVLDSTEGNIIVAGSDVRATQDISANAHQENIDVRSGHEDNTRHEDHKSQIIGDLGSNAQPGVTGNSNTVGVRNTESTLDSGFQMQSAARSSLVAGNNLTLNAQKDIGIHGADLAAGHDIDISARSVAIDTGVDISQTRSRSSMNQLGITTTVNSPVIAAMQTAQQMERASKRTDDPRMQALAAGAAGLAASDAYSSVAQNTSQAGGVSISVTLGGANSNSRSENSATANRGSTARAGNDFNITAQGAGTDSNIKVVGSDLSALNDVNLQADGQIDLLSAKNIYEHENKNSGASYGIGLGANIGANGVGFGITANASGSRGNADGKDVVHDNTHVVAGETVNLDSGGDTNLKGAVVSGKQVVADVGGDLNIESLQDTSTYESKQTSAGGSVTIGVGFAGSANFSNSHIDSEYRSVAQQSGIKAGDNGFKVNVAGNTDLKGAVIASTDKAVQEHKNGLVTGTLAASDIRNKADYVGKAAGVSLGVGSQGGVPNLTGAGIGSEKDKADSQTISAVSRGSIAISDSDAQQATGRDVAATLALLNRDVRVNAAGDAVDRQGNSTAHAIAPIFDADKVAREIQAQAQITEAFNQQAHQTVNNYVHSERSALREQLKNAATEEARKTLQARLDDLLLQERVMNVLIGAVTGTAGSALTKESLSVAANEMRQIMLEDSQKFPGVTDGKTVLTNLLPGKSEGVRGDGEGVGGTRIDLDLLCGPDNSWCAILPNGELDLKDGKIQFIAKDDRGNLVTLQDFIKTASGQKMAGPTGGIQGWKGTLFGMPYKAGSWQDKLVEAFAGTHDYIGGSVSGLYDEQGNIKRGMAEAERNAYDKWAAIALLPSTPFAVAELLPPEVWQAISIVVQAAK